jgi:hypothetical protein
LAKPDPFEDDAHPLAIAAPAAAAVAAAANPVGDPEPFTTDPSVSHNENGESKTKGLQGTLQRFDDGSVVIEATEALSAKRRDGLNGTLTAFCRRVQRDNVVNVQQDNYSYKGRRLQESTLFLKINGIPDDVPEGFEATPVRAVKASQFGKNDTEDEGTGSPLMGLIQTNSEVFGASVKVSIMKNIFGADWRHNDKRLSALIEVFFPSAKRMVRVPLVDLGPGEAITAEVDLTWACDQFLGTRGGARVQCRLLLPS